MVKNQIVLDVLGCSFCGNRLIGFWIDFSKPIQTEYIYFNSYLTSFEPGGYKFHP
jgi:hypothetical protein